MIKRRVLKRSPVNMFRDWANHLKAVNQMLTILLFIKPLEYIQKKSIEGYSENSASRVSRPLNIAVIIVCITNFRAVALSIERYRGIGL